MESSSSKNKHVKYLLCVIDVFTKYKYAWFKPLKNRKGATFLNAFIEIVNESNLIQINYGLIKEKNFAANLRRNG